MQKPSGISDDNKEQWASLTTFVCIEIPHSGIRAARPEQYAHDDNKSTHDEAHHGPNELLDPETYGTLSSAWPRARCVDHHGWGFRTVDDSPEEKQHISLEGPDEDDVGCHAGTEPLCDQNVRLCLLKRHGLPLGNREGV